MVETIIAPALNQPATEPTGYQARFAAGRKAAGVSLKAVADEAGVSLQAVSQFERGVSSMSLAVFLKCCAFLHLRTDYVLHGRGRLFEGEPPARTKRRRAARAA